MSLPKGYKRLEYIQSSGTQYVDSKFVPNSNTKVVADYESTATQGAVIGADTSWLKNDFVIEVHFAAFATSSYTHSTVPTGRHTAELNKGAFIFDGTSLTTMSGSFSGAYSLTLFALNRSNAIQEYGTLKLYSCQIYDNGNLVRDYIPCQNASGAVGLWDDVNSVFYGNAGTGTFTAGPVVPEQVDEREITELEYIQSSGTQYVDSGFVPNQDTRIEMDVIPLSIAEAGGSTGFIPYGAATSYNSNAFECYTTASKLSFNYDGQYSVNGTISVGAEIHISHNKNAVVVTAAETTIVEKTFTYQSFTTPYSLTVCASHRASMLCGHQKVKACQVYGNGLLALDFVPAMLSNGEVGLYDRVFHEFYRNAGTGEFVAGPEMVHEDYTELEYIESDGTQYVNTLFMPNQDTRAVLDFQYTDTSAISWLFGVQPSWGNAMFDLAMYANSSAMHTGYGTQAADMKGLTDKARSIVDKNKNVTTIDGITNTATANSFQTEIPAAIFAVSRSTGFTDFAKMILYSCRIYDNGTEVRIYVPMLHPSGVAGLWDTVNERFYASATTTDFIAGPEAATVPKAPTNFRVESETDTLVTLAWDASEEVLGYRLYRLGQLLADTTETSVSVTVEPFAGAVFQLTAYNENGEGAATELTYFNVQEDPILFLITDRTQQDVAEQNPKGYYAASDLNRVGYAVEYLAGLLRERGVSVSVSPVGTWADEQWVNPTAAAAYLADVRTIRGALKLAEATPEVPADLEKFTYTEANQIELILLALDETLTKMLAAVRHSGVTVCGMKGVRL